MKSEDQIQKEVITEIQLDPQLSSVASRIKVSVKQDVVTLSGVVDEYSQRFAAEDAAHRISGVKVVAVDIAVKENESLEQVADSALAENIRSALVWHSALNDGRLGIKVDEGWVYLEGHLNWDYERKAALNAIESIRGVKGIIDKITVNSKTVESRQIKRRIGEALHSRAAADSSNIAVAVTGSIVTLSGRVSSWAERKDAEEAAWSMPGVTEVRNDLKIVLEISDQTNRRHEDRLSGGSTPPK